MVFGSEGIFGRKAHPGKNIPLDVDARGHLEELKRPGLGKAEHATLGHVQDGLTVLGAESPVT